MTVKGRGFNSHSVHVFCPIEVLETLFLLHLLLGSAFAGRLRSELRQAITSCAEHDDSWGILLRVADTTSKSLEEANSGGHLSFFRVSITPQCSI